MAQTVAPGTGLTPRQEQFLEVVLDEKYLLKNFYLSGGTALSSWYLHHRESYDLDFFSDRPFSGDKITNWIKQHQKELGYRGIVVDDDWGFYTFFFRYPDNSRFKVDFNHYSFQRLQKGNNWKGLEIDSLYDIAVNKTQTILSSPRARDYLDLYFILKKTGWKIKELLTDGQKKFGVKTDPLQIARNFLRVVEFTDCPKILIPFDQKIMEKFYENLARSLKTHIF